MGLYNGCHNPGMRSHESVQTKEMLLPILPKELGLLDARWMGGLLLDWTVVAVQDTEDVEAEVAITTRLVSMKASWKL